MFMRLLIKAIKKLLNIFRTDVRRSSLAGALRQIRNSGFVPATVIDVGAAIGTFTVCCHSIFPESKYLLIEPLEENKDSLDRLIKAIPDAQHILAVAASRPGEIVINVHSDFVGSSLYMEKEADLDGIPRKVPASTLDLACKERNITGPYLIKVDVQGAELDVLSGAKEILDKTEYIILETSLFQFVKDGPQFYDVVAFMKSCGFVVYDMFGEHYKLIDSAMAQIDIAFVKENGRFRKDPIYATSEQRKTLTKAMLRHRRWGV